MQMHLWVVDSLARPFARANGGLIQFDLQSSNPWPSKNASGDVGIDNHMQGTKTALTNRRAIHSHLLACKSLSGRRHLQPPVRVPSVPSGYIDGASTLSSRPHRKTTAAAQSRCASIAAHTRSLRCQIESFSRYGVAVLGLKLRSTE
jgi:hypothetical protein